MVRNIKTVIKLSKFCLFILLFIIFLSGCYPSGDKISGVYVSNEKNAIDSIFIFRNHIYVHKIQVDHELKVQKGKWDYSSGRIYLYDFYSYYRDSDIAPATRITDINYSYNGNIEIEINGDLDLYYLKVK